MATIHSVRSRPLGTSERYVLRRMHAASGVWYPGCGWRWESKPLTQQILRSLALKGLVTEAAADGYTLTAEGTATADAL
jgi:hypothetical protein